MTRNRTIDPLRALGAVLLLGLATGLFNGLAVGPALAQAAGETIGIELNKLEPQGEACRAYLVVKNEGEQAYESLRLDLVMFDKAGVVAKRLAVQAAPLPVGKTSLKVFDITDHGCDDIGSILLNDVLECTPEAASAGGCLARIAVSARGEVKFLK